MDAYEFTTQLINSNTIMDFEEFTKAAIQAVLVNSSSSSTLSISSTLGSPGS